MKEILLVEDDLLYSKIISYILENSGYIVECANDAMRGMQMAGNKKYDLIVTDILMPAGTGLELLSHIKNDENCRGTKVLVLSILSNEYYMSESFSRGADEYLKKPVSAKDLVQTVKRLLYAKAA
jgi:CheY-like chemotaxis protein